MPALAASLALHVGAGVVCYFTPVALPEPRKGEPAKASPVISVSLAELAQREAPDAYRKTRAPEVEVRAEFDTPFCVADPPLDQIEPQPVPQPRNLQKRPDIKIEVVRIESLPQDTVEEPLAEDRSRREGIGASTVATSPEGAENPPPQYPVLARRLGCEGLVVVTVRVSRRGEPLTVVVKKSSGHEILDEAAADAVRRWTFKPATVNGMAIEAELHIPIRFKLMQ